MKCPKCAGMMVIQSFFDNFTNSDAWKCLNCGKMILPRERPLEMDSFSLFYQQNKCYVEKKKT